MSAFWAAFLSTTLIDLIELGSIVVIAAKLWSEGTEVRLVSFAAGVLLSTVFLDLLPEAVKQAPHDPSNLFTGTLLAMLGLFLLERTLGREHSHDPDTRQHASHHHPTPSRYFIIFGDGLHSMIDGFAIATAFIASSTLGIVTTLAVLAHEVPHQVGDYSLLRHGGSGVRRALIVNYVSAGTALAGVLVTFAFQPAIERNLGLMLSITAGMLLYIAAVNLLPELLHGQATGRALYATPFIAGLAVIAVLLRLFAV
jgi:zinc and cadmium transporter